MKIKTQVYDTLTTILGLVVGSGALLTVDYVKLIQGDRTEITKVVGAFIAALYGWLTNKTNEMKVERVKEEVVVVKEPKQ